MSRTINSNGDVEYTSTNSKGQVLKMNFTREDYTNSTHWYVSFWVNKRGKGYQLLQQTGKDGINSLIWAKNCVKDFIQYRSNFKLCPQYIIIHWDGGRRRDIYQWGLKSLGFTLGKVYLCKCLYKKI